MSDKNKINVVIDGRNFTVVGGDNERYIRNLAYYVDEKIKGLASKNERLSQTMAATLAALNIADEYHKTTERLLELEEKAKDPLEKYSGVLDELADSNIKVEELSKLCKDYKEELIKIEHNKEQTNEKLDEANTTLASKSKEVEELQNLIIELQDRNFQSQIELVESKKQLKELLKLLDEETNMFKERKDNSEK